MGDKGRPAPPPGFELIDEKQPTKAPAPPPGFDLISPEEAKVQSNAEIDRVTSPKSPFAPISIPASLANAHPAPTNPLTPDTFADIVQGDTRKNLTVDELYHGPRGEPERESIKALNQAYNPAFGPVKVARATKKYAGTFNAENYPTQEAENKARTESGTEFISGVMQTASPLMGAGMVAAPVRTGVGLGTGLVTGFAAKKVAAELGATPETQDLAETVGFFLPSALGLASGLRTEAVPPEVGKGRVGELFGGKVKFGAGETPEGYGASVQFGENQPITAKVEKPSAKIRKAQTPTPEPNVAPAPPEAQQPVSQATPVPAPKVIPPERPVAPPEPTPAPVEVAPEPQPPAVRHPEVPGGKVVGIDADSGLPIVKREQPVPNPQTPQTSTEETVQQQLDKIKQHAAVTQEEHYSGDYSAAKQRYEEAKQRASELLKGVSDEALIDAMSGTNQRAIKEGTELLAPNDDRGSADFAAQEYIRRHPEAIKKNEAAVAEFNKAKAEARSQRTGQVAQPAVEPAPVVPERRADLAQRQRVAEMTPDQMRQELLTSRTTGLPNRRAFDESQHEPAPIVGMSDADGLKAINDKFGYDAGNELLKAKADALREAGLEAYHDKGDEFLYRGASPEELQSKLEQARENLRNRIIEVTLNDGSVRRFKGADFSYGTGQDISQAETGLKSHKAEREARGERARGELRGITEVGAEPSQVSPSPAQPEVKPVSPVPAIQQAVPKPVAESPAKPGETRFPGGRIVENTALNRIQIIYDQRPDKELHSKLRHGGFVYSPTNKAYQRQLNANGRAAAERMTGVKLGQKAEAPKPAENPRPAGDLVIKPIFGGKTETIPAAKLDAAMEHAAEQPKGPRVIINEVGKDGLTAAERESETLPPPPPGFEVVKSPVKENLAPPSQNESTIGAESHEPESKTRSTEQPQTTATRTPEVAGRSAISESPSESGNAPETVSPERDEATGSEKPTPVRTAATNAGVLGSTEPSTQGGNEHDRSGRTGVSEHPATRREGRRAERSGEVTTGADGKPVEASSPEPVAEAQATAGKLRNSRNFRIPDDRTEDIGSGGDKAKINANLDAIQLLKNLEKEGRIPTPEEQMQLARYVDFGGLRKVWDQPWNFRDAQERMEELLTPEEIAAIKETSLNTHYTSIPVVDAVWSAAKRLGFTGGRVLEPGMGIGNFFGRIPKSLAAKAHLMGVEKNIVSGRMATMLYPDAKIIIKPYEQVGLPNDSMDMIIGNPPFADIKIFDPLYRDPKLALHNYFIVKSLDKLKPGGIAALVTSHYTMDAVNSRPREEMFKRADLIGAIRLPNDAFKKNAGTEVTTDILFFRKRIPGEASRLGFNEPWLASVSHQIGDGSAAINEYFVKHPEMVLGNHSLEGSMYRDKEYTVKASGEDLAEQLAKAIKELPQDAYGDQGITLPIGGYQGNPDAGFTDPNQMAPLDVKENAFFVEDGKVYVKQRGARVDLPAEFNKPETVKHLKSAITLRDALKDVIRVQMESESDADLHRAQKQLGKLYDDYRKSYGPLTGPKTAKVFSEDPEYPLLTALENIDPESKAISKADIFSKRTARPYEPLRDLPTDPKAAMLKVLAEKGALDTKLMAKLLKKPEAEIIKSLTEANLIYRDPVSGLQSTADEYLSGNVRVKLKQAQAAAEIDPEFERNVKALQEVQPEPVPMVDIDARLGQTWIEPKFYANFVHDLAGQPYSRGGLPKIGRDRDGRWTVDLPNGYDRRDLDLNWSGGDVAGHKLIEYGLNQQLPTIYRTVGPNGEKEIDPERTAGARAKLEEIKERFSQWIKSDRLAKYHKELEEVYNDTFNGVRLRDYNGDHLEFPGLNPDYVPRPYQRSAVWRIVQEGRALIDHFVGAGKTLTMMSSGMELRRLGLSRKNLYVVPNNMVPQWREDFKKAYPGANVLAVTDRDLASAKNRRRLFARIATNEWDAVIVPHSQFNMLPISPEREMITIKKQMAELEEILDEKKRTARKGDRSDDRTLRQIENAKQKFEQRIRELSSGRKDNTIYFDDLGVDQLFIDEAHAYKALPFATKMGNIQGLSTRRSQRAQNVLAKVEYMFDTHKGRGVVFATGTPITNTLGEQYLMTRYLAPDLLEKAGIRHFDDWAANFATTKVRMDYSIDGVTIKPKASLSVFVNVPELQSLWSQFADVVDQEAAVKAGYIKLPKPNRKDHLVKVTPEQEPMLESIAERGEALKNKKGPPQKGEDNWLKLDTDSRDISLDARFHDPSAKDDPGSKAAKAAEIIKADLDATEQERGTVLVVCDRYESGPFNIFKDIKAKLVKMGVPAKEIAIVHDYPSKEEFNAMQSAMRAGKLRVLFGTTEKVGVGLNIQKRLKGLVHMDLPQRPDQVTQREGRIIRTGNMFDEVNIHRLISEPRSVTAPKAHDLQRAQNLERKQTFLTQFKTGGRTGRHLEDVAGEVRLSPEMFAIAKAEATGNPMAMEKIKLEHEIRTLSLLNRSHILQRNRNRSDLDQTEMMKAHLETVLPQIKEAARLFKENEVRDKDAKLVSFKLSFNGKSFDKLKEANEYLKANPQITENSQLSINGVDIPMEIRPTGNSVILHYKFAGEWHPSPVGERGELASAQSVVTSILARARDLDKKISDTEQRIASNSQHIEKLKAELAKASPYDAKIKEYEQRLSEVQNSLLAGVAPEQDEMADATASEPDEAPEEEANDEDVEEAPKKKIAPGPGAKTAAASSGLPNEVGMSDLEQLTDSLKRIPKGASPNKGTPLGQQISSQHGAIKSELARKWGNLKDTAQRVLDTYRFGAVKYTTFDKITNDWKGEKQEGALQAKEFAKTFLKHIPNKQRREAMTNYLEADGDAGTLQDRADLSRPKYADGYRLATELTPEEKTAVENIKNFDDSFVETLIKEGMIEHAQENFVTHFWKKAHRNNHLQNIMSELNFSALQPNPSFTKKRVWSSFFEGEQKGADPVSKDIAFLVSAHVESAINAIADRHYIKKMFSGYASDGRPLLVVAGGVRVAEPTSEEEKSAFLVRPTSHGKETGDYKEIGHPALRRWKWVGEDENGNTVYLQGNAYVHPEAYHKLKNNLGTSWVRNVQVFGRKPGLALLHGTSNLKGILLQGLPTAFHQAAEGQHALFHRVSPSDLPKLDASVPDQKLLIHNGLQVADFHAAEKFGEGLGATGIANKIPGIGPVNKMYTEYLFDDFIPRVKMKMGLHALARNRQRYGKQMLRLAKTQIENEYRVPIAKGKLSQKKLDRMIQERAEDMLAHLTAEQSNAAFGELNYEDMGRNKTVQDVFRLLALAPDFLEARARFVGQALRPYGREQLIALALGAAVMYVLFAVLNKVLDGDYHLDKPFTFVHKGREYAPRTIQGDIKHLVSDPRNFFYHRMNPTTSRTVVEWLTGRDERGMKRDATDQLIDFAKQHVPIPAQGLFVGQSGASWNQRVLKSVLSMIGVNTMQSKTAAERKAGNYASEDRGNYNERPQSPLLRAYRRSMQEGPLDREKLNRDYQAGKITQADRKSLLQSEKTPRLQRDFASLPLEQALDVWESMSEEERRQNRYELWRKSQAEIRRYPVGDREKLQQRVHEALQSKPSLLPGFLQKMLRGKQATQR